jgi:hypothetical protein
LRPAGGGASAAGHRPDDQERLVALRHRLREHGVGWLVRQVLLTGEVPDERAPRPGSAVADGGAKHRVPGFQRVQYGA